MPSPARIYINNTAVFVTTRTEEGLPFVPTDFMNLLIWGILAKAQMLYPEVAVCGFTFLPNHFHMLLVVKDPEQVSKYIGYIKQEMAHAINRLLGRRQKTIWKAEYDAPVVLDAEKLMKVLTYLYLNPVEAGLVALAAEHPGVSSFDMLKSEKQSCWHLSTARDDIPQLLNPARPYLEDSRVASNLKSASRLTCHFNLEPFAWKNCFESTRDTPDNELKEELLSRIKEGEERLLAQRKEEKLTVLGAAALKNSSMIRTYSSKKFGKRMICLASERKLRVEFLTFYRNLREKAKEVFSRWVRHDYSEPYPPGLFLPARLRAVSLLHWRTAEEALERVPI